MKINVTVSIRPVKDRCHIDCRFLRCWLHGNDECALFCKRLARDERMNSLRCPACLRATGDEG